MNFEGFADHLLRNRQRQRQKVFRDSLIEVLNLVIQIAQQMLELLYLFLGLILTHLITCRVTL